jgi:hypothetical protein
LTFPRLLLGPVPTQTEREKETSMRKEITRVVRQRELKEVGEAVLFEVFRHAEVMTLATC